MRGRLENLVTQTNFDECEIIVVNSGSQQNEEAIVKEFQRKHQNIILISTEQRETIYKAWNRAIRIARGRYITNANADDRLRRDALAILSKALDSHPDVGMVYADQYITPKPNSTFEESTGLKRFHRRPYSRLRLLGAYLPGPQSMWRASLHHREGIWFDEQYEVAGDYDFACQVAEKYPLLLVPEVLGVYFKSPEETNKEFQNIHRTNSESYHIQEKYARRFVESLSPAEFADLYRRMRFWVGFPRFGYTILHRMFDAFSKERQILNKIFWCWLGSMLEEHRGDKREAERLCAMVAHFPAAELARRQYRHLNGFTT